MMVLSQLRLVVVILLMGGSCSALSSDSLEAAVTELSTVKMFAFGGVGFVGQTSRGEVDFQRLISQDKQVALDAFEKLYAGGNGGAKLYALAGFKWLNPARFKELLPLLEASKEMVGVQSGCIWTAKPLREIASEIDHGRFDPWIKHDFDRSPIQFKSVDPSARAKTF